jgi:BASS family bile acid:Na+ symporter
MANRALRFYTKYFAVWVVLFGVAAYAWPGPFLAVKGLNEWFFSLTMFGIGAVLTAEDFKRIAKRPTVVVIGSVAQFSIMPLGAFVVAKGLDLPPAIAVGLVLTGSAPGAMASNVMSYIAKADTAYSVSLTTVSTLLCPLLTPGLTLLLAGSMLEVEFGAMFWSVMKMVIVPVFLGYGVRHWLGRRMSKVLDVFPAISVTFIIFICSLVIAANKEYLGMVTGLVVAAVVVLNLYGMGMGYGVGRLFGFEVRRRRTLSIEIGMQNAGLGVVLALKHFGAEAAMPAAVFVFVCILTASVASEIWQRRGGIDVESAGTEAEAEEVKAG